MIKAVIFDFDGLLADTEIISYRIYKTILERYGHSFSMEEYAQTYSGKTEKENIGHMMHAYSLPVSFDECFLSEQETEKELFEKGVELKPGVLTLLKYLNSRRYKIAIATSSDRERAMKILKKHCLHAFFMTGVFAEDIRHCKPDPEIFLKAAEKLGENPENCLVLEDSEAGIQAACIAGMKVICVPDMKRPDDVYLDKCIAVKDTLDEVIDILDDHPL